jgi:hypothetical protein
VQVVVDGSVRKVGALRVNARLVSVADDQPGRGGSIVREEARGRRRGRERDRRALTVERGAPKRDAPTIPRARSSFRRARHE